MRKVLALAVAAIVLAAGCVTGGGGRAPSPAAGSPGAAGSPAQASGRVVWLAGIGEDPSVTEPYARELVARFRQQYPNIDLVREAVENDQLRTILQTRLRSNNPPDLFGYDTGPGYGGVLARAGLTADLTQAYQRFGWKHFEWAKARCTYGGKVSCLPDEVEELGIFYNKALFDQKGFTEPKTLEELTRMADALKADGIIPLAFGNGGDDFWTSFHQFSMTASNILGREELDKRIYGEASWNTPEVVKAIDVFFRQFVEKGYFPPSPTAIGYDDANALFYDQKAAMIPSGTWLVGDLAQKAKFEVGFFPFPAIDGSSVSPPAGLGSGLFMAANSRNPEAALVVMDFLHSDEVMRDRMVKQNEIPAFPLDTTGLKLDPLFQEVVTDLAESSGEGGTFGFNIDVVTPANFNDVMAKGFQDVMNGDKTPEQQAADLEKAFQEAKAKGETLERP